MNNINVSWGAVCAIVACIVIIFVVIIGACIVADRFKTPFQFPAIQFEIDISGRRLPSYGDCIDQWIIDNRDYNFLIAYRCLLAEWDKSVNEYLEKTWFWKGHKNKLYNEMRDEVVRDDYKAFEFLFLRNQTRYKQRNYQRYAYTVQNVEHIEPLTLSEILTIDDSLREIGYETTREKYYAKNQRKLMTKELRRNIIKRDSWTCQICGKYMPDEVGLHVDHIVPIKKGGKTVPGNLQVTCDKCNLRKGTKMM